MDITFRRIVRGLRNRLAQVFPDYKGDKFGCPLCETKLDYFLPVPAGYLKEWYDNSYVHPIFRLETMHFDQYLCPACHGSDRDRLYAIYLQNYLSQTGRSIDLIEFAPTVQLKRFLKKFPTVRYRSADLNSELADDKVDMCSMAIYGNDSFDFFICSHVLEHIPNDRAAAAELFRILKPGGRGIAMVPIDLSLNENYENPSITGGAERWQHFCQDDHVRLYSKAGFLQLLHDVGFEVEQHGVDSFGLGIMKHAGIHPRSLLYIAEKPTRL
jgi:SAM-dependent methyltransferase